MHTGFIPWSPLYSWYALRLSSNMGPTLERYTWNAPCFGTRKWAKIYLRGLGARSIGKPAREMVFDSSITLSRNSWSLASLWPNSTRFVITDIHLSAILWWLKLPHLLPVIEILLNILSRSLITSGRICDIRCVRFFRMIATWYGFSWMHLPRIYEMEFRSSAAACMEMIRSSAFCNSLSTASSVATTTHLGRVEILNDFPSGAYYISFQMSVKGSNYIQWRQWYLFIPVLDDGRRVSKKSECCFPWAQWARRDSHGRDGRFILCPFVTNPSQQ